MAFLAMTLPEKRERLLFVVGVYSFVTKPLGTLVTVFV
jgi:hypothetical protein